MMKIRPVHWLVLSLVSLSLCGKCPCVGAADWPQWRGPPPGGNLSGTGLVGGGAEGGAELLWQTKALGLGYSTPAVVGERLYLVGNEGLENEFVEALSVKDGKRVWSARLGKVGKPEQQPSFPAGRSTPTVEGEVLYALGSD